MLYTSDKRRMKLAYFASVICIAFFLYITLYNINQAERETKKVSIALGNLYRLANILTDVHAVETGQRGYVITGDELYLFTYNRGLDSIVKNIDLIIPDSADSKITGRDKELLLDLIRQKVLHAKNIVNIRTRFGIDSATTALKSFNGEILMNRIRVRINSLETTLRNDIARSNAKRESTIKRIAAEFLILGLIIYLILFFNYRVISKELKIRRKNEEILKFNGTLISSIIDPIITTDLHHRITNWNKHAEELYGWKEHEVIGKNLEDLLQIEYVDVDMDKARQQFADQGYWKGETTHVARDGKTLHILSSVSAVNNDEGKPVSVVGVFTDVTAKKEIEQRLQLLTDHLEIEVERKALELNSVFDRITDAFIALDSNWIYTYVNSKAAEMHGRPADELVGKNIWELYPEQVGSEFYDALHKAVDTGAASKRQLYYTSTGQWFEDLIYPGPNGVSVYYHDITEKKTAELKLQEAHDKLNSHINNTPIAVLEFDKELHIVQWSPKATEIFGWTAEEASQPGFTIFDMVYAGDLNRITETSQTLLKTGKAETLDFRNVTNDDKVIYCEWYFSVLKNRNGEVGIMALVHDITERRKTELALQETESKFRSLVEESLVGVYIIQKGKFTYVNPRFAEIVGYSVEEIVDKVQVLDLVCDHDKEKVENNLKTRMFGIRKSMHYMFDAMHKSGKILNVEVYGTFLLYKGEGAVIGTLIDVTERNKYLRMLEASEFETKLLNERFQLVGKATQDAIWDWDIKSNRILGNDSFMEMFGFNKEAPVKFEDFIRNVHPEDAETIKANLDYALENHSSFVKEEFRFKSADNTYRIFNDRAYILYDEAGAAYRMLGAMQDVTIQRSAQKQLLIEKQLSDSIINSLPGVFYVFSKEGKMLRWNKNLEDLSATPSAEIENINPVDFFPESEREFVEGKIREVFVEGETTLEARLQPKGGDDLHFYFTGMLINYEGEPCVMGVGIDITEKVKGQEKLQESEEKFRSLIEQASDGIFISDSSGRFIMVNTSASLMSGYSREELLKMKVSDILFREDQSPIRIDEEELRTGNAIIETLMKHKEGHFVYVESSGKHLSGNRFQSIIRDITGRKKAEEEVRISEYKYRLLFEQNPMPMWMISLPEKNFLAVNDAAIAFYGYSRDEFQRMNIRDIRPGIGQNGNTVLSTYKSGISNSGIWEHRKKNGEVVKVNVMAHDIIYQGRHAKLELANDMTEKIIAEEKLKYSHAQLRQLATHLQSIRESERTHMAREIHDELGQQLTGLKMDISWINKKISDEEPVLKQKINETLELVDDTVKTVRRLATQLRPSILDDLGLGAAMEWQSEEFQKRSGIETHFTSNASGVVVPDEIATGIFRIFQESLTNVMRHSKATKVGANLSYNDGSLILQIVDNGVGYNENEISRKNTLGLLGMKERTLMMEGTFEISSRPGKGTSVIIVVPLNIKE